MTKLTDIYDPPIKLPNGKEYHSELQLQKEINGFIDPIQATSDSTDAQELRDRYWAKQRNIKNKSR